MSRDDELPRVNRPTRTGGRPARRTSVVVDRDVSFFFDRMVAHATRLGLVSSGQSTNVDGPSEGGFVRPLLDACAATFHVLSFYQGRHLDEGFLDSAKEDRSIFEIARMLGVRRRPAMSAESYCSMFAVDIPGDGLPMVVPAQLPVQSVPIKGGLPQIFESTESILVHPDWNEMELSPESSDAGVRLLGDSRGVVVRGTVPSAVKDIPLLIRGQVDGTPVEVLKVVQRVGRIPRRALTVMLWDEPLLPGCESDVVMSPEVLLFGPRVPILGSDAPEWDSLSLEDKLLYSDAVGGSFRQMESGSDWERIENPGEVTSLLAASDGFLYAGLQGAGIVRLGGDCTEWSPANSGLRKADILCVSEDATGSLLVGTRTKGVLRSPDGGQTWNPLQGLSSIVGAWPRVKRVDTRLPDTPVRCVLACTDATGTRPNVLAGTDAGVFSFDQTVGQWHPLNQGLPGWDPDGKEALTSVRGLVVNPQTGTVFAATDQGLFCAPRLNKPWSVRLVGPAGVGISCIAIDAAGVLYAGLDSGGLAVSGDNGTNWVLVGEAGEEPMSRRSVHQILAVRDTEAGREWVFVATDDGLWMSTDRGARWVRISTGLNSQNISAVCISSEGAVHIASPISGVVDEEWPGFDLDNDELILSKAIPEQKRGAVALLEQKPEKNQETLRTVLSVESSTNEQTRKFGLSTGTSTLHLEPTIENPEKYSRRTASVRMGVRPLRLLLSQIVHPECLKDTTVSLDTILQTDGVFAQMTADRIHLKDLPRTSIFVSELLSDFDGRRLGIVGRRARVVCSTELELVDEGTHRTKTYAPGSTFELQAWPVTDAVGDIHWTLCDPMGFSGGVVLGMEAITFLASDIDAAEVTLVREALSTIHRHGGTHIDLDDELDIPLDLGSIRVHGNVVHVHHGQRVDEVLGSGDGTLAQQSFCLKQGPLSWSLRGNDLIPDIQVDVSGRPWRYIPTLDQAKADELVFSVEVDHEGQTWVHFGDGQHGSRLQTGIENVVAHMRIGSGVAGNVEQGHIRLLRQRPPMVRRIINLTAASGGVEAESAEQLRSRIPMSVRLGRRVVSITDFEDKVRSYPGVAHVRAEPIWGGTRPVLCLTVTTNNTALDYQLTPSDPMYMELHREAQQLGEVGNVVEIHGHEIRKFRLHLTLLATSGVDVDVLTDGVRRSVMHYFSFQNRSLTQPVTRSEIMAFVSDFDGVINVGVRLLSYADETTDSGLPYLTAQTARWSPEQARVLPAQMLSLPAGLLEIHVQQEGQ